MKDSHINMKKMINEKEYKVIKVLKKGKKYLVYFDNFDDEIILNEDKIVEYRIIQNAVFSSKDFSKIKKAANEVKYYEKVVNYINFKPRTRKEVYEYLKNLEASETQINTLIKKLESISYINDERYTESFVSEYIRKKKGSKYIEQTLEQKGIEKDLVYKYLDLYTKEQEIENATLVANKYAKSITKNPIKKQRIQINNKLISEGYPYDVVNRVLYSIELLDESETLLEKEYIKLKNKEEDKNKIIQKLLAKGFDYSDIKEIINNDIE